MSRRRLHVALMTQDELPELKENLVGLEPFVDSITVVDGGSTDGTVEFLKGWAATNGKIRLFQHPWEDNFPKQRNKYLRHAAEVAHDRDWIVSFDPDEFLDLDSRQNLHQLCDEAERRGFYRVGFQCRSVTLNAAGERIYESLDDYRKGLLYRWHPKLEYFHDGEGPVHESLRGLRGPDMNLGWTPGTTSLCYEHRKLQNIIWVRGCLPTGERIITERGYVPIENVVVGDLVLAGDGALRPVMEVMSRPVDEEIVEIRGYGRDAVRLTKEHPVWAAPATRLCPVDSRPIYRKGSGKAHDKKGYSCCREDVKFTSFGWVNAEDVNKRHIMEYPRLLAVDRATIPAVCVVDGGNQYQRKTRDVPLTPDLCRLFGYWLAEGHFEAGGKIGFSFSAYELATLVEDVAMVVSSALGRSLVIKATAGNCARVEFGSVDLQAWMLAMFGEHAPHKRIPLSFIAALSDVEKASLLKGLWLGDGTRSDRHYTMTLSSPHLALASWVLCQELNLRAALREIPLETLNRSPDGFRHRHPMFRVTVPKRDTSLFEQVVLNASGPYFKVEGRQHARPSRPEPEQGYATSAWYADSRVQSALPASEPTRLVHYKGLVHNIEVEETHSYCTPYMTVHNCRNYFMGGGGPNLGRGNHRWVELREWCAANLGIPFEVGVKGHWATIHAMLRAGNVHPWLKEWMIRNRWENGWDGASEQREWYKAYFRLYHPEEEPEELRGDQIP